MRIKELAEVTGLPLPAIKDLRHRGVLPFDTAPVEGKDQAGRTWSAFGLAEAMLLIAAHNLVESQGLSWGEAAKILRAKATHTPHDGDLFRSPGFHCARVEFRTVFGDVSPLAAQFVVYRGSLSGIVRVAEKHVERFNETARFASDTIVIRSFVSVSLSQAWDLAVARAQALGVDVSPDFQPESGGTE